MDDYKSCIAKRTRAQEDIYLVQLWKKMKMERGELPKSKTSGRRSLDSPLMNSFSPCKCPAVPKFGFDGNNNNRSNLENEEVKADGNESKEESERGQHEPNQVTDSHKLEISDESQSQEPDEVIDVDEFPFDEFEVETSDESLSDKEGYNESDEAIAVDSLTFAESEVETSDESDVESDESMCLNDTITDEDDRDYQMEHADLSASEESSSSEDEAKAKKFKSKVAFGENDQPNETEGDESKSIDIGDKKPDCDVKTNSESKVQFGESRLKYRRRAVCSDVGSSGDSEHDLLKGNTNFEKEAKFKKAACEVKKPDCHAKTKSKSIVGYDESDLLTMGKKVPFKSRRHTPFVWSTLVNIQKLLSCDRSTDDTNSNDLKVESSNFSVHANESNTSEREDKHDRLKKTEAENVHRNATHEVNSSKVPVKIPPKVNEEDGETRKQSTKRKRGGSDICRILADSILGERDFEGEALEQETLKSSTVENILNYKFRFEDEDPAPVEKSELDIEVEKLFEEMYFALKCKEMGSYNTPMVENEENTNTPVFEKSQFTLCSEGKHQLILDDEIGLRCLYCFHVEREIRYVIPEWAKYTSGVSRREKYYGDNGDSGLDELHFKASGDIFGNSTNHAKGSVWNIVPATKDSMFPHQREGFEFLWKNLAGTTNLAELNNSDLEGLGGCIISHAPGTGKTRLTVMFIQSYLKIFPNSRPIVIAPANMLLTWEEEFRKWQVEFPFYNLNSSDLLGNENIAALNLVHGIKCLDQKIVRMAKLYSWSKGNSILGVSYSLYGMLAGEKIIKKSRKNQKKVVLDNEKEELRKIMFEYPGLVVLDEGHTPRNDKSRIWNTLLNLQTEKRIILSGTPFQNNFGELFNTLRLVRPAVADVLAKDSSFGFQTKRKYSRITSSGKVSDNAIEKLKATIAPFVNVHKGSILRQSLPGLRDSVILLTPPLLQESLIETMGNSKYMLHHEHRVALVSIHPSLILHCTLSDKEKSMIDKKVLEKIRLDPEKGVKTRFVMDFISLCVEKKEKVLIFSQFIAPLELIKDQLGTVYGWNENQVLLMLGDLEQKQRQILITRFNNSNDGSKIMLASTRCCAEGINLVGASRVILLDVVWNPSVERQAISRAYRLGQKKVVYTYHLMTSGTIEGDKYCRQAEKDRLSELVFSSPGKEHDKEKSHDGKIDFDDEILDAMVGHSKLKDMFKKIITSQK